MAGASAMSDFLGYASIACWLGAQFPQILENIRQQSSDGLALPFLANWALGDLSNLIGCVLTHQLPFQTLLATYFVFVDFTLLVQYFYYRWKSPPPLLRRPSRARTASAATRRLSSGGFTPRYRTLSVVAANVAAAVTLAVQQDEQLEPGFPHSLWPSEQQASGSCLSTNPVDDDADFDDDGMTAMTESFHSDAGSIGRRRVSWSTERYGRSISRAPLLSRTTFLPPLQLTSTESHVGRFDTLDRGRSRRRELDDNTSAEPEVAEGTTKTSSSGASRPGAGMIFLATWAFFSFGTLAGNRVDLSSSNHASVGRVLSTRSLPVPNLPMTVPETIPMIHPTDIPSTSIVGHLRFLSIHDQSIHDTIHDDVASTYASRERILGRIFAWLCAALYLTSRLPQIRKNFIRKSVEGLSMYLFVFAFLGNVFYVSSILSSPNISLPPPQSAAFIKESIPYILGSAGTLIFDITIVSQSFIYRPRPRRYRGRSSWSRQRDDEEAGLLTSDSFFGTSS